MKSAVSRVSFVRSGEGGAAAEAAELLPENPDTWRAWLRFEEMYTVSGTNVIVGACGTDPRYCLVPIRAWATK